MKTVQAKITYVEKARRIEMLFRIVWGIIAGIVLCIFALVSILVLFFHFFYILIYARRNRAMHDFVKAVQVQSFRLICYLSFLTDERPPIVPEMNV